MYAKRIQLINYGPIDNLEFEFPFEGETPRPVVLVGENGSGKSILLSHIVNGLIAAKGVAFPDSPEVESGKVYKLRSSSYIRLESDYYFSTVEFEEGLFVTEMRSQKLKREYESIPTGADATGVQDAWNKMMSDQADHFDLSAILGQKSKVGDIFSRRCVLYFPANRFEEPAWLNEENLKAQAQYMDLRHIDGKTERRVINYAPLNDNQNRLLDFLYDRAVLELQTRNLEFPVTSSSRSVPLPVILGYVGSATAAYETALQIVRTIMRSPDIRFGIGRRDNRVVSIMSEAGADVKRLVPNVFQLSSGETSLLNLFLSILRDFDLCGTPFSQATEIRGIVVVDEIDLHLHAVHQHEVLPELIQMFPNVQFVVTTHSPLFVLGMQRILGKDGFDVYRLPEGRRINPEEFSEFGSAYRALTETARFSSDMRAAIAGAQRPIVFVEGATDQLYIEKAAKLLTKEEVLERLELRDGGGKGNMAKLWKDSLLPLTEMLPHQVMLLFDCDTGKAPDRKGKLLQRSIPLQYQQPIKKGIENLFSKSTLEKARRHNPAFFSTEDEHGGTNEDGQLITIPEKWSINDGEKTNLCDWLCENGTPEDFRRFQLIFDLMEEALGLTDPEPTVGEVQGTT